MESSRKNVRKRGSVDDSILLALLKGFGAVGIAIGGWIGRGMHSDIRKLKDDAGRCELRIQEFRTHVSENYAKDASVQASLSRIHDRLDEMGNELGRDIKTILTTMKR